MPITAVVLLRGSVSPEGLKSTPLEGGTLVKTSIRFDLEPEDLGAALRARMADVLDGQSEPRGVFVLPDVAMDEAVAGKTYEGALEAVGDGGSWIRATAPDTDAADDRVLGMDDILAQALSGRPVDPAMLASLLGGMPDHGEDDEDEDDDGVPGDAEDEDDDAAGMDLGALMSSPLVQQMMAQMADALSKSPDAQREIESASASGNLDLESLAKSPAIAKLVESMGQTLGNDPAALASLLGTPDDDEE
jgi:hypothetical protein